MKARTTRRPGPADGDQIDTFLPARIDRAADAAAEQVLTEDYMLRKYGIEPEHGRSR